MWLLVPYISFAVVLSIPVLTGMELTERTSMLLRIVGWILMIIGIPLYIAAFILMLPINLLFRKSAS